MSKDLFIKKLKDSLSQMSAEEMNDVIADYDEYFEAGKEQGRSEEEIASSLGDPETIAQQFKVSASIKKAEIDQSAENIFRAVFAFLALGFIHFFIIIWPFFGLLGVLFAFYMTALGAFVGGVFGFFAGIGSWINPGFMSRYMQTDMHPAVTILLSISSVCFGMLFAIGCWFLTKWLYIGTIKYLKFNMRIIKGEKI